MGEIMEVGKRQQKNKNGHERLFRELEPDILKTSGTNSSTSLAVGLKKICVPDFAKIKVGFCGMEFG